MKEFLNSRRAQIALGLASIASFVVGLVAEVLADFLPNRNLWVLGGLIAIALIFWALALRLAVRTRLIKSVVRAVTPLRLEGEKLRHARRGVVVFVSLYRPIGETPAKTLTAEQRQQALNDLDYVTLDLENSTLKPTIDAMMTHASRLEHCWVVSTISPDSRGSGSYQYVPVLVKYLREEKGLRCEFHDELDYAIPMHDDAQVTTKTRDLIENIIKEALDEGLSEKDVIADFTSGVRSMTLGMILACLDKNRDIQFQGTRYDANAEPIRGQLFPVLFDFEIEVIETT